MQRLGVKGQMVGRLLEEQIQWQIRMKVHHPSEENIQACVLYLKQKFSLL